MKAHDSKNEKCQILIPIFREVHILIETYEEEEITLLVSYVVTEAGWTPKYDLRVHSRDKLLKVSPLVK